MRINSFNENYIKEHINEDNKTRCIKNLTTQIQETEKEMLEELNTGYLSVINKCSKLELLTKYIQNIQITNNDLFTTTNETILRNCNVVDEKDSIEEYLKRLDDVKHEIMLVNKFIKLRQAYSKNSKVSCFETVRNLKEMEGSLTYFKKYNFYMALNQIHREMYTKFITYLQDLVKNWLLDIDYIETGRNVKIMEYEKDIFDPLHVYRKQIISKEFLKVFYAAKELSIEAIIMETINNNRQLSIRNKGIYEKKAVGTMSSLLNSNQGSNKSILKRESEVENPANLALNKKVEDSVDKMDKEFIRENQILSQKGQIFTEEFDEFYSLITNILLSYFLVEFFPQIQTFYDEIIEELQHVELKHYDVISKTLLPLKKLITVLKLDSEKLDLFIEKISFEFFDQHNDDNGKIDYLIGFIDDSVEFLSHLTQFNNELDDLLAVKIDKILNKHFDKCDSTDEKDFVKTKKEIWEVLMHLKSKDKFYDRKNYEIENQIYLAEERFVNVKTGTILENKNIKNVVKELVKLKTFMDENTQRKIIRKISNELLKYYKGDDLVLFKDTIKRNFGNLGGIDV